MTMEVAQKAAARAYGADGKKGIQQITILTPEGPVVVPRKP